MKLLQYRKGFATNSSSTHSIIIANRLTKVVMTGEPLNKGDICSPGQYGWDYFTLASHKAKMRYLATLIMQNLELPIWMQDAVAFNATGAHVESEDYIDHQSVLALPVDWNGKGLDQEFIKDLVEFVSNEDVMILGGSDNNDSPHPLSACGPQVLKQVPRDRGIWVARKEGNEWTLFCRDDGTKITFTFDDSKVSRARPSVPELIDIKCTNFCAKSCAWCYQNSNKQGKHADHDRISRLAWECEKHKVFEINFGGGEPTLWPHFVYALEEFRRNGVVPNFTTRSLAWLRDEKLRPEILELCGAFAVSVDKGQEVRELADLVKLHRVEERGNDKVCIHYVLGSSEDYNLTEILREAHRARFIITLLGWKSVGRGVNGPLHDNSQWLKTIKELHKNNECPQVGIDTTIANEYEKEIKKAGIPDYLFYTEEGKFSIYYDAVEDKWGPSSFCEESEYVRIPRERDGFYNKTSELIDAWNKIKPTKGKRSKKE